MKLGKGESLSTHQKVEDAEAKHRERDADVSVVVEEVEHADAQTALQQTHADIYTHQKSTVNARPAKMASRKKTPKLRQANSKINNKLCGRPPQYAPAPYKLTFDLLTLKVVPESRATWATSVPILVFLGLSVLDLGPIYATDRRQTRIIA